MMFAGPWRLLWAVGVLWVAPALAQTVPYTASVRWQPSTSAGVVGYHVYTRALGAAYGVPLDALMPTPAPDGTMSFLVAGLDPSLGYAFSATAYANDGTESALSNELTLPARITTTTISSTTTTRPPTTSTTATTSTTSTTSRASTTSSTTTTLRPTTSTTATTSTTTTTSRPTTTTTTTLACSTASQCNDQNPCTTDTCSAGVCRHTAVANGTRCSDGNACNGAETCQAGVCQAGTPLGCDDGNPCTVDSCDPAAGCTHVPLPDNSSCDDGIFCNGHETCRAGTCTPAAAPACDDGKACTVDSCDEALKRCVHQADGCTCVTDADCGGADVCGTYRCDAGHCASSPIVCPAGGPCTQATCDPTTGCGTENVPDGTPCHGDNACVTGETCSAGVCRLPAADIAGAKAADEAPVKLAISRFVLKRHGRSALRLLAKASFPATMLVEPDRSGMTIEIDDGRGGTLYSASVPPEMFGANYVRTRFVYAPEGPTPRTYAGLKMLAVVTGGPNVVVTAKAIIPASALQSPAVAVAPVSRETAGSALTLAIRWGTECASRAVMCSGPRKCQPL